MEPTEPSSRPPPAPIWMPEAEGPVLPFPSSKRPWAWLRPPCFCGLIKSQESLCTGGSLEISSRSRIPLLLSTPPLASRDKKDSNNNHHLGSISYVSGFMPRSSQAFSFLNPTQPQGGGYYLHFRDERWKLRQDMQLSKAIRLVTNGAGARPGLTPETMETSSPRSYSASQKGAQLKQVPMAETSVNAEDLE